MNNTLKMVLLAGEGECVLHDHASRAELFLPDATAAPLLYSISSGSSLPAGGNVSSMSFKSSSFNFHPVPPAFSRTCSALLALQIANKLLRRVRKFSAT